MKFIVTVDIPALQTVQGGEPIAADQMIEDIRDALDDYGLEGFATVQLIQVPDSVLHDLDLT